MASGTKDDEKADISRRRRSKALKHPIREAMYAELEERPMGLSELAEKFNESLPWIEYHYRVLEAVVGIPWEEDPPF